MNLDEALAYTIDALKRGSAGQYGYDLYPTHVASHVASQQNREDRQQHEMTVREWSPLFYDAAWELCRRGFIRPGVRRSNEQVVPDGGYSLTAAGSLQLAKLDTVGFLVLQPGSLSTTLNGYSRRYGDGYHQRSQEAIKCRNAEAWLACCSMVGAAAESILLAVAIAKSKDENVVLSLYRSSSGRQKVINLIVGKADARIQTTLKAFAGIIAEWRDEASHGQASVLSTANADEALRQLLHMCQWVDKEWEQLTA